MKGDFSLLIKLTVFLEHVIVKEIPAPWLYITWKSFSLLYRPSAVNPLCFDAANDGCGALSYAPHSDQHAPVNPPIEHDVGYLLGPVTKNEVYLPTEPTIGGGCLLSFRLHVTAWIFVGVKGESGTCVLNLLLIILLRHCSPSLRHISYPASRLSVTARGTTFVSAMMDSHTTPSIAVWVSWHMDAHKYDQAHMDARQG